MSEEEQRLRCSRCLRESPPADTPEFQEWVHADISVVEFLDDTMSNLLICPDCRADEASSDEIGGEG